MQGYGYGIISKVEWLKHLGSGASVKRIQEFSANLENDEILTLRVSDDGLWKMEAMIVPVYKYPISFIDFLIPILLVQVYHVIE